MRTRIKLAPGETLKEESHRSKGSMSETDIWTYAIVDSNGNKVGSVDSGIFISQKVVA